MHRIFLPSNIVHRSIMLQPYKRLLNPFIRRFNDETIKKVERGLFGLTQKTRNETKIKDGDKIQLKRVFDILDKDKDGYISPKDLRLVMETYGKVKTNEEIEEMIDSARRKVTRSPSLNFDQFHDHFVTVGGEDDNTFTETARLLYLNEDFQSRMLHLRHREGFICDMDGVIYRGGELLEGVDKFLSWIKYEKKKFTFLTNNSKQTPKQLQNKLRGMGLNLEEDVFLTSAQTTASFLLQQKPFNGSCFIIGGEGLHEAMYDVGFSICDKNPDYVIVGESDAYDHEELCKATQLVHAGARLICTNSDVSDPIENGSIAPSGGAWVSVIEVATGKKAYFPGKPNPLMMRSALDRLNLHSSEAVMIGDRMETDVLSGIESNLKPVLVLSGVTKASDLENYPYRPFLVLDSVGDIPPKEYALL